MLGVVLSVVSRATPMMASMALNHVLLLTLVPERPTNMGTAMTVKVPVSAPCVADVCVSPYACPT